MATLTTGLIANTPVAGVRPSSTFEILISNNDTVTVFVEIKGFYLVGTTKTQYVDEIITIQAGSAITRNYFVEFDAFEFEFITSSDAVEISAWGKDSAGNLIAAHRVLPSEFRSNEPSCDGVLVTMYNFEGKIITIICYRKALILDLAKALG